MPAEGGAAEKIVDGGLRGDWVPQPSGSGTWMVTSGGNTVRLIDVERRSLVWEAPVPGSGLSLPMVGPDGRSFSMPHTVDRDRDAIGIFDLATGARRSTITLPFHVWFRASWVDDGRAFLVNRSDTVGSVALFDRFWNP